MDVRQLLTFMVQQNISDIHFKVNSAPLIRLNGRLISTGKESFTAESIKELAFSVMNEAQKRSYEFEGELDFAYHLEGLSRFRVNIYRQKGTPALSIRVVPLKLKSFEELHLPAAILSKLASHHSGLVLVAGVTGAGKTTTMNMMVDYINETTACNIITIEDPIEFYHSDRRSSISQREVGSDTGSYAAALKYILRQDPDVIVIGEMRDEETISAAVTAAETGHLVLSTIHTMDAAQTIQRIIDSYAPAQQNNIRMALANVLKGIVAQKLIPSSDNTGRFPCHEILVTTPYVKQAIMENKFQDLYTAMVKGASEGMNTFDQDLLRMCQSGKITSQEALDHATRQENFLSMLSGISGKL